MPDTAARKRAGVPAAIAVVAAFVAALALLGPLASDGSGAGDGPSGDPAAGETSRDGSPTPADEPITTLERRDPEDPHALGDPDAPVVMINYSEFQCPFCGKFARDTEPTLREEYVENGTLRIEWRDFPYLGDESTTAARAGRAAGAQGKFWEFHDAMYADQPPPNSGTLTEEHLVDVADRLGLDTDEFRADLRAPWTAEAVARDFEEGQYIGVTGTPAFVINGRPVIGAQPTDVFVDAIERAAKAAR